MTYVFLGRAKKFKITLNSKTLTTSMAQSTIVHKFGHALCLHDNPSSGNSSIMNYNRD